MEHLLTEWPKVSALIKGTSIMLYLDYDGTLTPIVRHPDLAQLGPAEKEILRQLVSLKDVKVSIISGRSLKEIENLIGISGFLYAGNHGLEFEEQGLHFEPTEKELFENILPRVELKLKQQLENFKGVWVENKTLTLSVHYRELQDDRINEVKNVIMQTLQSEVSFQNLVLRAGKKVWEIRPPSSWNKGKLALWLLARIEALCQSPFLPIYIGDDQTDEDAFGVLVRERGVCVRVTQNPQEPTGANYYLSSPKEVFDFLSRFIQLKSVES